MFDLDPDSMGAYFLEESIMAEFDGYPEDECIQERWHPITYQTCKWCKSHGLHWQQVEEGKYRLFNSKNKLHACIEFTK